MSLSVDVGGEVRRDSLMLSSHLLILSLNFLVVASRKSSTASPLSPHYFLNGYAIFTTFVRPFELLLYLAFTISLWIRWYTYTYCVEKYHPKNSRAIASLYSSLSLRLFLHTSPRFFIGPSPSHVVSHSSRVESRTRHISHRHSWFSLSRSPSSTSKLLNFIISSGWVEEMGGGRPLL